MINRLKNILLITVLFCACTIPRKYQKNKPFVFKNNIEIKGGKFSGDEKNSLKQKMFTQLDDSLKTNIKDFFFALHFLKSPAVYDSSSAARSAKNIKGTVVHLGYYGARVEVDSQVWKAKVNFPLSFLSAPVSALDRLFRPKIKNLRIETNFTVIMGNPTLIDTFSYKLRKPELQEMAINTKKQSLIKEGSPVTRADVLGEINRLVELYRNNGYYKFTADELRMRGDTTIAALTSVSDDPFETIRLLAEAEKKRDSPTIKLALVLNPVADTSRLMKYYINNIHIFPDYTGDDSASISLYKKDTLYSKDDTLHHYPYILSYNNKIVKNKFLLRNLLLKKGDLYKQDDYNRTVNNLSRTGVWQNVNMQVVDRKDSAGKIDMFIQLVPSKKYGFEGKIEASYSTNSNSNSIALANSGNLLGLSGNVSLQSRNAGRQGIKVTHGFRAGIELNLNARPSAYNFINSSEISYSNTISIPKGIRMPKFLNSGSKEVKEKTYPVQTFINTSVSNTNRIGLFKLNSLGFAVGVEKTLKPNKVFTYKLLNIEYSNLYNRSDTFIATLVKNPYLRYSFNTALVFGHTMGLSYIFARKPNNVTSIKFNAEESGFWFFFPVFKIKPLEKDIRNFIKADVELINTVSYGRSAFVKRLFIGVGAPIGSKDTTLPFFKQYFAGGPNSMRAWPIRGIGPGSKPLSPYTDGGFNDRTGDIRFEANLEYRKDLLQIIPNTLTLKWALFADIGNVWNFKNTQPDGSYDSTQFRFKNFYKELGVNLGTGFRFDFNYVVLRFDFGFRVKRPELSENAGWKFPSIGFDDLWGKLFQKGKDNEYRKWRYENFNFTIGLNYPF